MKGNRQGSLSRSITRRSDQNCKIILQILILQFCSQLVKKVQKDFFDKLKPWIPIGIHGSFESKGKICGIVFGKILRLPAHRHALERLVFELAAVRAGVDNALLGAQAGFAVEFRGMDAVGAEFFYLSSEQHGGFLVSDDF